MIANKRVLAIIIFFITAALIQADSSVFKHNINFGMKRKKAKKTLENVGYEILDETKVSKQLRTFLVEGFLYTNISEVDAQELTTKFEFYNNKLMNSTVLLKSEDSLSHNDLTNKYITELAQKYGKPKAYEKVMSIKSWMWLTGNNKILLNSDSRRKTTKISYIYLPVYAEKYEDEVKIKLKGEPVDPAKEMFLR
jgi:hypothetical protein